MERIERLFHAALKRDCNMLRELLEEDPLILDRCYRNFGTSPLHIAAQLGDFQFSKELLVRNRRLAEQLDSNRSSPLHLSSANGHLEVVQALLHLNPDMCFARDVEGRNPLHLAAINGQLRVLELLMESKPQAAWERVNNGETILHLCVKYSRWPEPLHFLVGKAEWELLNAKDICGSTVLHLAAVHDLIEILNFLSPNEKIDRYAVDANGLMAIEIVANHHKSDTELQKVAQDERMRLLINEGRSLRSARHSQWLENQRVALMVVASMIAAMAFQAGVNPPGGAWQQEAPKVLDSQKISYIVGSSVMASAMPSLYIRYIVSNTVSFISSISILLLLMSRLPPSKGFMRVIMLLLGIAVCGILATYILSVTMLSLTLGPASGILGGFEYIGLPLAVVSLLAYSCLSLY